MKDELLEQAKQIAHTYPRGHAGTLQEHLSIGYNKATQLLQKLESLNVISIKHGYGDYKLKRPIFYQKIIRFLRR